MKNINNLIHELVQYGISAHLIAQDDIVYTTNRLLEFFKINEYAEPETSEEPRQLNLILEDMLDYAAETGLLENDTITYRDLFDTAIMGQITPPPSVVREKFFEKQENGGSKAATDYYYSFSKATNYIRTDRIAKDEKWEEQNLPGNIRKAL